MGRYQGRGRHNGRGRGGAGNFGGRGFNRKKGGRGSNSDQGTRYLFAVQSSNKPQMATYAQVKEKIIQHVQTNFNKGQFVSKALQDERVPTSTEPTRGLSKKTGAEAEIEQTGLDIKYQEDYRKWKDNEEEHEEGLSKAYALIFDKYCTTSMQHRIEQWADYDTRIKDNPIELLKTIQEAMSTSVRAQYPFKTATDTMKRALLIKQWDNEDLLSYVKRFKQQRDILKSHIGKDILLTFIKKQEAYTSETSTTRKKELEEGAFEAWMAYQLLANCDQSKYGSLLSDLTTQYSLGQDVFP